MLSSNRKSETSFTPIETEEFVPFATQLPDPLIPLGSRSQVIVVLWISPHEFYIHLKSHEAEFDEMMKQIQVFYQNRKSTNTRPTIGDTVIVHQANENVFKRARIIDYNASLDKYRVQSLDYGDKAICQLSDIYDVEKSFVRLPSLAVWCSLQNVVVNYSRVEIQEKIDKYIDPTRNIKCDFLSTIGNITYVEMLIDGVSFRDSLIADSTISLLPIGEC